MSDYQFVDCDLQFLDGTKEVVKIPILLGSVPGEWMDGREAWSRAPPDGSRQERTAASLPGATRLRPYRRLTNKTSAELDAKLAKVLERVDSGKVNGYRCQDCGAWTIAVDLHEGTTCFMIGCEATPDCNGTAFSAFYKPPAGHGPPVVEFYKPTREEFDMLTTAERSHVLMGGLMLRRCDGTPTRDMRIGGS